MKRDEIGIGIGSGRETRTWHDGSCTHLHRRHLRRQGALTLDDIVSTLGLLSSLAESVSLDLSLMVALDVGLVMVLVRETGESKACEDK